MTAYDRWLEAPYQEAAERADALDEIAEALMEDECNPRDVDVFMEALANDCLEGVRAKLELAIADGNKGKEKIGEVIWDAVYAWCADQAENLAVEHYNTGKRHD
jgi:hypothetical protein